MSKLRVVANCPLCNAPIYGPTAVDTVVNSYGGGSQVSAYPTCTCRDLLVQKLMAETDLIRAQTEAIQAQTPTIAVKESPDRP